MSANTPPNDCGRVIDLSHPRRDQFHAPCSEPKILFDSFCLASRGTGAGGTIVLACNACLPGLQRFIN